MSIKAHYRKKALFIKAISFVRDGLSLLRTESVEKDGEDRTWALLSL